MGLFLGRGGKDNLVLGTGLVVDGIDGIDDIDDILDGDGLVRAQDDTGIGNAWLDTGGDKGLEPFGIGGGIAYLKVVVFINIDGHILLRHGLAATFGKEELDSVGTDEGGGHHEENQEEKHQVRHGGVVVLDGQFIACLYHGWVCF